MEGGPPIFTQRFTCVALLAPGWLGFRIRGCHPLCRFFPKASPIVASPLMVGLVRVRSPLLTESRLISFPPLTEMFHFSGFAISSLFYSGRGDRIQSCQVTPFGNRRVSGCVPLTDAYRSLSRPSSPPSTKAFTLCPLLLDFFSQILRSQSRGAYLPGLGSLTRSY